MRSLFVLPCRTVVVATVVGAFSMYANAVTIIFVDADASPGGDGSTWPLAYQFLQDALEDASGVTNDQIWVAEGTYYPDDGLDDPPINLRNASFELIEGVAMYGGFAATETLRSQRDPETNITTLSGDIDQDDGGVQPEPGNSYHVVTAQNVDSSTVLSGFTITKGWSDASAAIVDKGGGILIDDADPVITRCTLTWNRAGISGGGMAVTGDGAPAVINCTFSFNNTAKGGGMSLDGPAAESTLLMNCLFFFQLRATQGGGAIYTIDDRELQVVNCTLWYNDFFTVGAQVFVDDFSVVTITNSIIWELGAVYPLIRVEPLGSLTVSYSDVQGGLPEDVIDGGGNIDMDPKFVNDEAFPGSPPPDLRLGFESPCIDKAFNDNVEDDSFDVDDDLDFDESTPDLDLNARIEDGEADSNFVVDMGSFEYRCLGDLDYDGEVGIEDFLELIVNWGPNPGHPGDLNRDGEVGINDFLGLLANWGACPGGTGSGLTLQDELDDACITQAEYDDYVDVMTDPTSKSSDKIRYDCWMRHWIFYCPACTCAPEHCPGVDPFS